MKNLFSSALVLVLFSLLISTKNTRAIQDFAVNSPTPVGNELIIANDDCCNQTEPAVARSSASGNYMVAWMDRNPTYPTEPERGQIKYEFVLSNGTITGSSWFVDGKYNSAPDIAYDSVHDPFLVVWENRCTNRPLWGITALQFNASTGQLVGDFSTCAYRTC